MLDFNRHHRNRRPIGMGMNTPRRLLTLAGLGALMLLLVWRGQQWGRLRFGDTSSGNGGTALQARLGANDAAGDDKVGPSDRQALFPGVNRAYLDTIRDDTVFRAAEGNAWFHLLALLAKTDGSALKTASLGQVGYLQLDEQPDSYRGRLVTVEGVIRAAKQVAAPENEYDVTCVAFGPDGKRLALGDGENNLRIYDSASGEELRQMNGHTEALSAVVFAADGKWIVSGSADDSIKLWDAATGVEIKSLGGHTDDVTSLATNANGQRLLSGSSDRTVRLWDLTTGKELMLYKDLPAAVASVAIAPDGKRVAIACHGSLLIGEVR